MERRDFLKKASVGVVGAVATIVGTKSTEASIKPAKSLIKNSNSIKMPNVTKIPNQVIYDDPVHIPTYDLDNEPITRAIPESRSNQQRIRFGKNEEVKISLDTVIMSEKYNCIYWDDCIPLWDFNKEFCGHIKWTKISIADGVSAIARISIQGVLLNGSLPMDMKGMNRTNLEKSKLSNWVIYWKDVKYEIGIISYSVTTHMNYADIMTKGQLNLNPPHDTIEVKMCSE